MVHVHRYMHHLLQSYDHYFLWISRSELLIENRILVEFTR
jgi:hypothetical protein